jgi:acetoin:2,6-dichlorophenolindophenol oxidoreductase subunit alpha
MAAVGQAAVCVADTRANEPLPTDLYLRAFRLMLLSRVFDERCSALLAEGKPVPHFHSGVGQEALMVASVLPLRPSDTMIYTHRGYGHLLAKGISLREVALDTFMKVGGTNHGLGGNMHVARPDIGVPGREGVFGTRFSIALGISLANRLRDSELVTVCFYGEAAGARGILYESLNMAVLWKLPVVYIAENNGWSFSSRTEWLFPGGRMSRVWRGFDIPVEEFDGNDPEVVYPTVARAVERARAGHGPSVLEGLTYRLDPHIWYDKAHYQPREEVERWRERDPIAVARAALRQRGVAEDRLTQIGHSVMHEVDDVFATVESSRLGTWGDVSTVIVQ